MPPRLRCIPLGGLGEIGRNMMVLEYEQDIVIIDVGVMFPEIEMLGVDLVIPDVSYLLDKVDRIRGVVITHGHEDHTGSLPYVLPQLNFPPVWATSLTAGLISVKLKEHRLTEKVALHRITPGEEVRFGAFRAEFFRVCHSIPDGVGVALHTPAGLIVHTGDFKLTTPPSTGARRTSPAGGARARRGGCASSRTAPTPTARATPPPSGWWARPWTPSSGPPGAVIVTTFASLISRIQQIIDTAAKYERRVGVIGRSMVQNVTIAQELGYLSAPPGVLLKPEEVNQLNQLPPRQVVLVTTGARGSPPRP